MGKISKYIFVVLFFVFTFFANTDAVCANPTISVSNNLVISQKTNKEDLFLNNKENNSAFVVSENSENYSRTTRNFSFGTPLYQNNLDYNFILKAYKLQRFLSYSNTPHSFSPLLKNEVYTRAP